MIQSEQLAQCNRLIEKSKNRKILFTLKAWPVIALATIGLCFLTQQVGKLFGFELPDQANIEIVRQWGLRCFDSWRNFRVFTLLVLQVILILPALEELVFRGMLVKLPKWLLDKRHETGYRTWWILAGCSSAFFSAAHYIRQPWPDAAFAALFFFGLAQCWLYRKTDRIWCAILNHGLFNLTNLVLLFIIPQS